MNLLDRSFKNGSITAKEYRDMRKKYFGKPKIIQMDLFPDDPKKKQKGGLMEQTNGLKKMGLKKGGRIRGPKDLKDRKNKRRLGELKSKILQRMEKSKKKKFDDMTPQEKKEFLDKIKKDQGKLTNPFLKFNKLGQPYMEAKGGGLAAATAKLKAQGLKKGGFPDLSGDGKVTMKDILMGRGVIKKPKKKQSGGAIRRQATQSAFEKARQNNPRGRLTDDDLKKATSKPSMTLKGGKLKGVKDAPEELRREKIKKVGKALSTLGAIKGVLKGSSKLAGRLAKRGYGLARK